MDIYSLSSLKQQSLDQHVAQLGRIILIQSQPVFALSPYCCVLSGEATNTNLIVFYLIRSRVEPTIYRTQCKMCGGEACCRYDIVLLDYFYF